MLCFILIIALPTLLSRWISFTLTTYFVDIFFLCALIFSFLQKKYCVLLILKVSMFLVGTLNYAISVI